MPFLDPECLKKGEIPGFSRGRVEQIQARSSVPEWSNEDALSGAAVALRTDECVGVEPSAETPAVHHARYGSSGRNVRPRRTVRPRVLRVAVLRHIDRQTGSQLHDSVDRPASENQPG